MRCKVNGQWIAYLNEIVALQCGEEFLRSTHPETTPRSQTTNYAVSSPNERKVAPYHVFTIYIVQKGKTHQEEQQSIHTPGLYTTAPVRCASAVRTTAVLGAERSKRTYSAPFRRPLALSLSLWMTCVESNLIKPVSKGETKSIVRLHMCWTCAWLTHETPPEAQRLYLTENPSYTKASKVKLINILLLHVNCNGILVNLWV